MRRVVVTGVGIISPLGLSAPEHYRRLLDGECGLEPVDATRFRNYPPILQSRIHGFDARRFIPDRMLRKLLSASPATAVASAAEALADARVEGEACIDCGLFVGSVCLDVNPEALIPALRESISAQNVVDLERFATRGIKLVDPLFLVKSLPNAGLCAIAIQHQVLGANANLTNGTVSGMQAVIAAFEAIRDGTTDLALAGGYDSLLQMDCVIEHLVAGRLALLDGSPARSCRPFRADSAGYALGEGAAFVLLESFDRAKARAAAVYGELLSYGEASAPLGLLDPAAADAGALAAAVDQAMAHAPSGLAVDVVFGDAVAVPGDDDRETSVFCRNVRSAGAFTASTPALGFLGAASGPFSLIHALLGFRAGVLPPVLNCDDLAADSAMPVVRQRRTASARTALVWNSDRGIKNAALLVAAEPC